MSRSSQPTGPSSFEMQIAQNMANASPTGSEGGAQNSGGQGIASNFNGGPENAMKKFTGDLGSLTATPPIDPISTKGWASESVVDTLVSPSNQPFGLMTDNHFDGINYFGNVDAGMAFGLRSNTNANIQRLSSKQKDQLGPSQ